MDYCSLFAFHASDPILGKKRMAYRPHVTATNQLLPELALEEIGPPLMILTTLQTLCNISCNSLVYLSHRVPGAVVFNSSHTLAFRDLTSSSCYKRS